MGETRARLTRHARNRVLWIGRHHRSVTVDEVALGVLEGETLGYDDRGNRRIRVRLGSIRLVVVVDDDEQVVITVWVE